MWLARGIGRKRSVRGRRPPGVTRAATGHGDEHEHDDRRTHGENRCQSPLPHHELSSTAGGQCHMLNLPLPRFFEQHRVGAGPPAASVLGVAGEQRCHRHGGKRPRDQVHGPGPGIHRPGETGGFHPRVFLRGDELRFGEVGGSGRVVTVGRGELVAVDVQPVVIERGHHCSGGVTRRHTAPAPERSEGPSGEGEPVRGRRRGRVAGAPTGAQSRGQHEREHDRPHEQRRAAEDGAETAARAGCAHALHAIDQTGHATEGPRRPRRSRRARD